jgi:hypothetical protein
MTVIKEGDEFQNGKNTPTPGVFVRVANNGFAGHGTWKCVRRMGERNGVKGIVVSGEKNRRLKLESRVPQAGNRVYSQGREMLLQNEAGDGAVGAGGVVVDDAGLVGAEHALTGRADDLGRAGY